VVLYASEIGNKYLYQGDPLADADIKVKRMVKQGSLEWIFPELDPLDFEPNEWFSNSTYQPYYKSYMDGFNLVDTFHSADDCFNNIIRSTDDIIMWTNNLTFTFDYTQIEEIRLMYPVLNLTKGWYDHLSEVAPNCFELYV
jgi:hypothetical protein